MHTQHQQSHIPHLSLDIPREKFELDNGIDFVSDTGHYSPIAPTVTLSPFDDASPGLPGVGVDLDAPHLTGNPSHQQVHRGPQMYVPTGQEQQPSQVQHQHHHGLVL